MKHKTRYNNNKIYKKEKDYSWGDIIPIDFLYIYKVILAKRYEDPVQDTLGVVTIKHFF